MNKEKKIDIEELEQLGLSTLKEFWGLDNGFIETLNKSQVQVLIKKASLGMQFYKEVSVGTRAREHNQIRICSLLANNMDELEKMLKASVPNYYTSDRKD